MATVKFNLRSTSAQSPQAIYLIYRHQNKKLVYSIGIKVLPKNWNKRNQRVRVSADNKNALKINSLLNELEVEVKNFAIETIASKEVPSKEKLKTHLDICFGKIEKVGESFFEFIDYFIKASPERINPKTGIEISPETIKKYKLNRNILWDFAEQYEREVTFQNIDYKFYLDYVNFLTKSRELGVNTIKKHIDVLKTFLNAATKRKINTNTTYQNSFFSGMSEESESIYLNQKEIEQVYQLDLSNNKRLEKVRDLFICGLWTGLRFSDLSSLSFDNVKGNSIHVIKRIRLKQRKTNKKVVIPIHPMFKAILVKYNGFLPRISTQKFNSYVKEVCQLAGLDEWVELEKIKGGKRIKKKKQKWELVSSHTCRRSMATNLYKSGFPTLSIMKITGHTTERAFLKYIKMTNEEHADFLIHHWKMNQ